MTKDTLNFTDSALEAMYDVVDNSRFREDEDASLIYHQLERNLHAIPFGDYLKRYIYRKAGLNGDYRELPLDDYRMILREAFCENNTPISFTPTSAKMGAMFKNWLTQQTVKRNVVFLLGFGLRMSAAEVNEFLIKALHESGICFKNPFEVICWYCFKNQYGFPRFERLWKQYLESPCIPIDNIQLDLEQTPVIRFRLHDIQSDAELIGYLISLKTRENKPRMSVTARRHFDSLLQQTREIIAKLYNETEEDNRFNRLLHYRSNLVGNHRLFDFEKNRRVEQMREYRHLCTAEDITESDIEHILCAAIPTDRHGNLTPAKASELNEQFLGKRLSRQHIHDILADKVEVDRFDLITLNFFIYSQMVDSLPIAGHRYIRFVDSTNAILTDCGMGELYPANPYECFIMMCILSEEPLSTYADVWELSYSSTPAR